MTRRKAGRFYEIWFDRFTDIFAVYCYQRLQKRIKSDYRQHKYTVISVILYKATEQKKYPPVGLEGTQL